MGIFKGLSGKRTSGQAVAAATGSSSTTPVFGDNSEKSRTSAPPVSIQWQQFFSAFSLHESAKGVLMAFVGMWPEGLDPSIFASLDPSSCVERIRQYQTGTYPGKLRDMLPDARPDYRMVDGKIARAANMFLDLMIVSIAPPDESLKSGDKQAGQVVMRLVQRYADWPLAKLVFLLPRAHEASKAASAGKAAIVVIEDMQIQVYKGIENVLFDVYDGLSEGGRLSDDPIRKKLATFFAPTN